MIDAEQQERIEAKRNRIDKPHIALRKAPIPRHMVALMGGCVSSNLVYPALDFCRKVNPSWYSSVAKAARAWHYPEER